MTNNSRRGITLLFVISMIVLFLLMGTAFVVVSGDFLRSAKKRSRHDLHTIDADALLDRALYDVIREPDLHDASSPLRGHSLLGDMYGYGFAARVASATVHSSQQFLTVRLDFPGSARTILDGSPYRPPAVPVLAGLVLTFTTGPAKGMSTRIIDHQITGTGTSSVHSLILQPTGGDHDFQFSNVANLINSGVIVNGRPFAGTGAGNYDESQRTDQPALSVTGLQPNQVGRSLAELIGQTGNGYLSLGSSVQKPNSASTNESYDTFDFQNMFLAGIKPDGSSLTPSFHRKELVQNYPIRSDFRAIKKGGPNDDGVMVDNDNNGQVEGIWIDIGLPNQTAADGTRFKPLVSYTIVDLDGRININAHGNQYAGGQGMSPLALLGNPADGLLHRGAGYGPPEINLAPVMGAAAPNMFARYGPDGMPGEAGVRDGWSEYKLFGYPDSPLNATQLGTLGGEFGSAMDVHGRFAIGYPNDFRDVSDPDFPIGLPLANVSTSSLASEVVDSAYEMSFAGPTMAGPDGRGFDTPFTPHDLEGVFRRADVDSSLLSTRLWDLGADAFTGFNPAIHSITTDSFEVPTTFENLALKLANILSFNGVSEADYRDQVQLMLPSEVLRGLPMNVNRPFGDGVDNNGNGVVDEIGETNTVTHPAGSDFQFPNSQARTDFARHLYVVILLCTERVDHNGDGTIGLNDWFDFNADGRVDDQDLLDYRKMVAQWSINVVDFRDRDVIMTPFEVDLNPWDGWDVDGNITTPETSLGELRKLVWGSERPELLITETFASHDRRTQDLTLDATKKLAADEPDAEQDFDSQLVPNVSAFFELYNPWVMIDPNQERPAELYNSNLDGIDLQKKSTDGSSPVWRLLVTDQDQADFDPDDEENNPSLGGSPPTFEKTTSVRRIYFTQPSSTVDSGPEVYYPDPALTVSALPPGVYAVVGSAGVPEGNENVTYFGRREIPTALEPGELAKTRRISLNPNAAELTIANWDAGGSAMKVDKRTVVNIPIDRNDYGVKRNLGVSDPLAGYTDLTDQGLDIKLTPVADGQKFTVDDPVVGTDFAFDEPVDRKQNQKHYDKYLANDGLHASYRTVHLQRLANPLQPFDANNNPYRTVDSSSLDLLVFNGADASKDPKNTPPSDIRFGSFERRAGLKENGDPADNGQDETAGRQRLLFKHDRAGHQFPKADATPKISADIHIFNRDLVESFGVLNQAYQDAKKDQLPFAWLCWNNRPYVSQLELANVPFTSSYWMTRLFDAADTKRNVYSPPVKTDAITEARNFSSQFPYLLNFYSDSLANNQSTAGLHRVFDYLEVPSRFVGTESYINPKTFETDQGLSYSLAAPFDTLSNYRYPGKLNINTVLDARVWNGLMQSYATDFGDPLGYDDWETSRDGTGTQLKFANPLRTPRAANWVPSNGLVTDPAECGLFRSDGSGQPLFDYSPTTKAIYNNDDRAAYFKNDRRQRLGNLVTGRSSVFAIWITVGYFEVNADGNVAQPSAGGRELGADTGQIQRHRGFYIFDRSIPVAFEPGRNHNVDRAVLVRSRIE